MNELEHRILTHLKNHHRGSNNAITYKALSVELQINSRELRYAVANIVTNCEGCIGSNSVSGYFFIIDDEDYQYCHDELISRIKKLSRRAKGLRISYMLRKEIKPKQMQLI